MSTPHLDLDALADALAGAGTDPTEQAHLAGCSSCTSRLAELEAAEARVVAALADLPAPALPDGLADRLTAALAAQAPLTPPAAAGGAQVLAMAPRRLRRTWLPAAAVAVLALSGIGLGLTSLDGVRGGGNDSAATAAGMSSDAAGVPESSSGTDWSDPAAVEAVLPQVLTGGAGQLAFSTNSGRAAAPPEAAESRATDDATGSGAEPVPEGGQPGTAAAPEDQLMSMDLSADPLAALRTPEGLASCLSALLGPDEQDLQPEALDYALWQGSPALAVLLPDPDPARVQVFVVGPGCAQGDEALLHFVRVARP